MAELERNVTRDRLVAGLSTQGASARQFALSTEARDLRPSIMREVFDFVKRSYPERSGGGLPQAEKGARGKGRLCRRVDWSFSNTCLRLALRGPVIGNDDRSICGLQGDFANGLFQKRQDQGRASSLQTGMAVAGAVPFHYAARE
jgi:hypothetical protein